MGMIRLFVGHDPREAVAFDVFTHSVIARSSQPISVTPLALPNLTDCYAERHDDGSNDFIYTRFLVPHLCDYMGWALFADGDMLCRADIARLWQLRDSSKAVQVVKHQYKTKASSKYLGNVNQDYPRKNWSSVILWNCGHPANNNLRPEKVMSQSGAYLHRFSWLPDELIGELPVEWNWLVTEYEHNPWASLVHFTLGTPCFKEYAHCDYSGEWYDELGQLLAVPGAPRGWPRHNT